MAHQQITAIVIVLLCVGSTQPQRWSRQVQSTGFTAVGPNDWVPVQFGGPKSTAGTERQTAARVLNFDPPNLQQLQQHQQPSQQPQQLPQYIPQQVFHQPQSQQINFNGAGEPFQLVSSGQQRFQVQQSPVQFQHQLPPPSQHIQQSSSGQAPLLFQQQHAPPAPHLPRFHYTQQPSPSAFPPHQQFPQQQIQAQQPHISQTPQHQEPFSQSRPQLIAQPQQALHRLPQQLTPAEINQHYQFPTFIEQESQPQQQPLQHVLQQQYEVHQAPQFVQHSPPANVRPHVEPLIQKTPQLYGQEPDPIIRHHHPENPQLNQLHESEEEVQLLYVPLETLHQQNQQQPIPHSKKQQSLNPNNKYNVQPVNPQQINHFYTPAPTIVKAPSTTAAPSFGTSPAYTFTPTPRFAQSPATTPKPKMKSHQPPLAMFMLNEVGHAHINVNDVLGALKNAKNIDVLDSASKKSPKVFVGPSGLRTPDGYSKFELPYLSSIEQNRAERQVTKLPFFVAPLSYKAPDGFAKIPLPAPHVGSVVINRPPEPKVVEYQSVNLQVPQPQSQRIYPKKVHSSPPVQSLEPSTVFRSPPKYNLGFKLGSDVFTTTARPSTYYSPSSTRAPSTVQEPQYTFVSTTPSYKNSEPAFTRTPSTESNYRPFVSSTQSPKPESNYRQFVSSTQSPKTASPSSNDFYKPFVASSPKPAQQYEPINRRPQTVQSPAFQSFSASTTPATLNHEQSNRFSEHQSFRGGRPPVSSTQAPLSTYSSQQHEEEYSNFGQFAQFNSPSRQPSSTAAPKQYEDSFNGFLSLKAKPTANVQTEEYFNIQKSPQIESFALDNKTQEDSFSPNQFHPSKDYYNIPPITSSDSSASAPKPTESENYSFEPIRSKSTSPRPEVTYTSKPVEYSTRAQEILKMKNYFREQNSQKPRPQTSTADEFESSSPSSNQHIEYQSSSTTETPATVSNIIDSNLNPSPPRNSITYYTPRPSHEDETEKPVHRFKYVDSAAGSYHEYINENKESSVATEAYRQSEYTFPQVSSTERPKTDRPTYSNHRETYQEPTSIEYISSQKDTRPSYYENTSPTVSPYDAYTKSLESKNHYTPNVEINNEDDTESQSYNLPSELPPISANLPGLVNSLYVEQTESEPVTTTATPPTSTTRRVVHRGRRPNQSTRATVTRAPVTRAPRTTTVTPSPTDSDDYTTRRPSVRGRRPIHYANRTTTSRTPTARNPNRVRYNPTHEERQRIRSKQGGQSGTKDEDLEYQRDVLNQNYPVITKPTSTELPPTTESDRPSKYTTAVSYAHETERYSSHYRADPIQDVTYDAQPTSHSANSREYVMSSPRPAYEIPEHFSGIEDHMQIPQEHQTLHGEFYNSESDVSAAEAINGHRPSESHPVFLSNTLPTTTTDEVSEPENIVELQRTRRPNFIKRPAGGRHYVSTTASPSTVVTERYTRERYTIRPKTKQDAATIGYTPKPRNGRLRTRPTTTATPPISTREPELQTYADESYQQISRFNKDFYQDTPARTKNQPQKYQTKNVRVSPSNEQKRFKYDRFALDAQESQWSTKVSQNSFIPVDPESNKSSKSLKNSYDFNRNAEPEIVTAGSLLDDESNQDSYLLKVSSSFAGNSAANTSENVSTTKAPVSEASFVDLLEEAMSDIGNEVVKKQPEMEDRNEVYSVTTNPTFTSESSTEVNPSTHAPSTNGGKRRGVWKRVRVRPADNFETAESQNYGNRVFNSLLSSDTKKQYENHEKGYLPLHSFSVDGTNDEIDESEEPRKDDLTTIDPIEEVIPTAKLLPVELLFENAANIVTSSETPTTTTEQPESTTTKHFSDKVEGTEDSKPSEDEALVSSTTVSSTRRYDLVDASDDLMMEGNDEAHTEFPFSFDGVNDEIETRTEFVPTDRPFYDDYDTDLKVDATASPNEAAHSGSMMSEVKQKLTELFSFSDDYDYENSIKPKPAQQYTTIERTKPADTIPEPEEEPVTTPTTLTTEAPATTTTTMAPSKAFHKKLMESVIYATSTSTEISHETEICYRGRCIKSDKKP